MNDRGEPIGEIAQLQEAIQSCRLCPRLVQWREDVARRKVRRFQPDEYWGRPLPGFGDATGRLMVVGLAPAAHGGNRTGRMFTGDDTGNWLARALYRTGFCNRDSSVHRDDGLNLTDAYLTAAVRCAPPKNRPTAEELARCAPFLHHELGLIRPQVVLALGRVAFDAVKRYLRMRGEDPKGWVFGHGAQYATTLPWPAVVLLSYHPSRQNTQTGRLTEDMLLSVFQGARRLLGDQ